MLMTERCLTLQHAVSKQLESFIGNRCHSPGDILINTKKSYQVIFSSPPQWPVLSQPVWCSLLLDANDQERKVLREGSQRMMGSYVTPPPIRSRNDVSTAGVVAVGRTGRKHFHLSFKFRLIFYRKAEMSGVRIKTRNDFSVFALTQTHSMKSPNIFVPTLSYLIL